MIGGPYTTTEAAKILGIHQKTVIKYCDSGRISYREHPGSGRHRRIDTQSLADFLQVEGMFQNPVFVRHMAITWQEYRFNPNCSNSKQ